MTSPRAVSPLANNEKRQPGPTRRRWSGTTRTLTIAEEGTGRASTARPTLPPSAIGAEIRKNRTNRYIAPPSFGSRRDLRGGFEAGASVAARNGATGKASTLAGILDFPS